MIDLLIWYLWAQTFALGGSLIASHWLRSLPDRGYGIGKALGILLGGFAYWFLVTTGFSQNNTGAALLALAAVWATGITLRATDRELSAPGGRTDNVQHVSSVIIPTELVFAVGFAAWAVVRSYGPNIDFAGGEKFMESMMINAILRSPAFPPNDAWLSGASISYYYFGYVIFAMLIRISGIAPSIGFNLGGAMIFGLTVTSAFSLGFNLWARQVRSGRRSDPAQGQAFSPADHTLLKLQPSPKSPLIAGVLTAGMLALMGNMGGLMGALKCANALPQAVWRWLDIRETATQPYTCRGLAPDTFYGWWWDWSRVIKDTDPAGNYQEIITEVPIFSFVLGDNHPHVLALPFVLLVLGLTLAAFDDDPSGRRNSPTAAPPIDQTTDLTMSRPGFPTRLAAAVQRPTGGVTGFLPSLVHLILSAVVIGGLSFLNTWDFPVYATLFTGAIVLGRWLRREALWPGLIYGASVIALGYLIYTPFYATFSSQARGIAVNLLNGTRLSQFIMIFAPFLMAGLGFLRLMAREVKLKAVRLASHTLGLTAGIIVAVISGALILGALSSETRALAQELQSSGQVLGFSRAQIDQRLLDRLRDPWLVLVLGGGVALCAVLIVSARHQATSLGPEPDDHAAESVPISLGYMSGLDSRLETEAPPSARWRISIGPADVFVLLLFAAGALLTLAVEFVYVRDLFGTRMNTVFKFYYIGWALWAVAGAYAMMRLFTAKDMLSKALGGATLALVAAGLLWPVMAIPARTNNFAGPATLDGMTAVRQSNPNDAALIEWLNKNIMGDAHIVEVSAQGGYHYEGRISAFTGLPTVVGWVGHEQQWRGDITQAAQRNQQVTQLYTTTDTLEARTLLTGIDARYVIVGDSERGQFPAEGLDKFQTMCRTAFQSGNDVIYDCKK